MYVLSSLNMFFIPAGRMVSLDLDYDESICHHCCSRAIHTDVYLMLREGLMEHSGTLGHSCGKVTKINRGGRVSHPLSAKV